MADNVAVTEGAGKTIATDDITVAGGTTGQVQYVKLVDGTPNGTAAIQVAGGTEANALRVTIANDSTGVVSVDDNGGALTVDGTVTANLSATDNAVLDTIDAVLDTINAKLVTGTVIGDVNLGATDNAVLDQIDSNTDYGATTGGGTEAGALRVTIANNSTGLVSVDDGGGALTVDGTVTANLSATDNAVLDTIDAVLDTINAKLVTGTVIGDVNLGATDNAVLDAIDSNTDYGAVVGGGAEATALRVTIANDSTGVVTVDDGGGALTVDGTVTASNAAGDVAHDTGDSGNPVKVGGKAVSFDGTVPGTAVAEADRANFITDLYGRQYVETCHPRYFNARADYAGAQTNATVQASPGAGLKLYITDIMISNGATAGNITLLDGSGGTVIWEIYTAINGGCVANFRTPIVLTTATLLAITSTTVTTHSIAVQGYIAP
jgi:hypothetical protein